MTDHDDEMNAHLRARARARPQLTPEQAEGPPLEPDASRDNAEEMSRLIRAQGNRRRLAQPLEGEEPASMNELIRRRRRP